MARRPTLRSLGLALALMVAAGCPAVDEPMEDPAVQSVVPQARDGRPDIVMVVVCSLRRAQLGFAGYERDTTPFIDSLAAGGVSFERAVAAASWTKPSTASLLTGLTPNVHGMTDYYEASTIRGEGFAPKRTLADGVVTLPELLVDAGYATMGRVNNVHAGHAFNMDQGFHNTRAIDSGTQTPKMLQNFERWVSGLDEDQPFFFFMLTRDAHVAYRPDYSFYEKFARAPISPDAYPDWVRGLKPRVNEMERAGQPIPESVQAQWIDLYDAELRQLDTALSELPRILERAGRASSTLIVLTADHGERLFDAHGTTSHGGGFLEEHLIHIPLLFHGNAIPEGVKIDDVVRSIDVYPTLAELAGVEPPAVVQGRSLLPRIRGQEMPAGTAFASHQERFHIVRSGDRKLHLSQTGELALYDLERDPEETSPLGAEASEEVARLRGQLQVWLDAEEDLRSEVDRGETRELSPETLDALHELGYIE